MKEKQRKADVSIKQKLREIGKYGREIWEIVILTDRCIIKKISSKRKCSVNAS